MLMPRGAGRGQGRGAGQPLRGLMGGTKAGSGPSGFCLCPKCGLRQPHEIAKPCNQILCPQCGTLMVRE
jgi:hypothetical protein